MNKVDGIAGRLSGRRRRVVSSRWREATGRSCSSRSIDNWGLSPPRNEYYCILITVVILVAAISWLSFDHLCWLTFWEIIILKTHYCININSVCLPLCNIVAESIFVRVTSESMLVIWYFVLTNLCYENVLCSGFAELFPDYEHIVIYPIHFHYYVQCANKIKENILPNKATLWISNIGFTYAAWVFSDNLYQQNNHLANKQ